MTSSTGIQARRFGNRVSVCQAAELDRSGSRVSGKYHYDGDRLIGEEDMTGTVREYLYAGGEAPTAMRARQADGSYKNYFFATNTHGDVVAVTDRDGNIVNRYAYGPWGEATRVSEQIHQPFRYAGYRYEDGFDLYYLRARWYDAGTGRFVSRDSMPGSLRNVVAINTYLYTSAKPATQADPSGYCAKPTVISYVHGTSADPEGSVGPWVGFLSDEFPNSCFFDAHFGLGWVNTITGAEGSQIKRVAEEFRAKVGGRPFAAVAHSEGADIAFKAIENADVYASAVVTLGAPIRGLGVRERQHVSYWLSICGGGDPFCGAPDPDPSNPGEPLHVNQPDEYLPVGGGHSDYLRNATVKAKISEVLHRRGF